MRIINGRVINPKTGLDQLADIRIDRGMIVSMEERDGTRPYAGREQGWEEEPVIDAAGLVVAPGFIDIHTHFRDPGFTEKEDLYTGAKAAAAGGYTTVICMANTKPVVDTEETLSSILEKAKGAAIHVMQCASVTKGLQGRELVEMEVLKGIGAVGFTDDGVPLLDEAVLLSAMEEAVRIGAVLSVHEEDPLLVKRPGTNAMAPHGAEDVLVARDCMLALHTGARVNIQHISSAVSVDLIALAQKNGADVWAEATPHHFSLTEDAVKRYGTNAKMNPPLRKETDRRRIIQGLQDGTIAVIATDHAPHTAEEKAKGMEQAPSGIIGLETAFALGMTHLVSTGDLSLMDLLEKMTAKPAELYGLDCGTIEVGKAADLVIFDEKKQWTVKEFRSKSANSPFIGHRLCGKVVYTICGGAVVYTDQSK